MAGTEIEAGLANNPDMFGYWENWKDNPDETVAKDRDQLAAMADAEPERFTARAPKDPRNEWVLDKMREAMKADGIEKGMSLRYITAAFWGKVHEWPRQIIGSCVASGAMRAVTMRILCELAILGEREEPLGEYFEGTNNLAPYGPALYRAGREYAGINGRGDGSTCGGQIKGLQNYGLMKCSTPGLWGNSPGDFPEPQSSSVYRSWGSNSTQLRKHIPPQGQRLLLGESERVESASRSVELINELKPQMICSGWGFRKAYTHKDGFAVYRRGGRWPHNMTISGWREASDGKLFAEVLNSWGANAHADGSYFMIELDLLDDWLPRANCQSIGELDLEDSNP